MPFYTPLSPIGLAMPGDTIALNDATFARLDNGKILVVSFDFDGDGFGNYGLLAATFDPSLVDPAILSNSFIVDRFPTPGGGSYKDNQFAIGTTLPRSGLTVDMATATYDVAHIETNFFQNDSDGLENVFFNGIEFSQNIYSNAVGAIAISYKTPSGSSSSSGGVNFWPVAEDGPGVVATLITDTGNTTFLAYESRTNPLFVQIPFFIQDVQSCIFDDNWICVSFRSGFETGPGAAAVGCRVTAINRNTGAKGAELEVIDSEGFDYRRTIPAGLSRAAIITLGYVGNVNTNPIVPCVYIVETDVDGVLTSTRYEIELPPGWAAGNTIRWICTPGFTPSGNMFAALLNFSDLVNPVAIVKYAADMTIIENYFIPDEPLVNDFVALETQSEIYATSENSFTLVGGAYDTAFNYLGLGWQIYGDPPAAPGAGLIREPYIVVTMECTPCAPALISTRRAQWRGPLD